MENVNEENETERLGAKVGGLTVVFVEGSSCIKNAVYMVNTETLMVEFISTGALYYYFDVPYSVVGAWVFADSPGAYFGKYIRGTYRTMGPIGK